LARAAAAPASSCAATPSFAAAAREAAAGSTISMLAAGRPTLSQPRTSAWPILPNPTRRMCWLALNAELPSLSRRMIAEPRGWHSARPFAMMRADHVAPEPMLRDVFIAGVGQTPVNKDSQTRGRYLAAAAVKAALADAGLEPQRIGALYVGNMLA